MFKIVKILLTSTKITHFCERLKNTRTHALTQTQLKRLHAHVHTRKFQNGGVMFMFAF